MSRYPWNEKPERYAQLDQERRMTTDHTNDPVRCESGKLTVSDETPEAPPAREPGWYWVRLKNNRISGEPGEWTPHFVHPVGDGGVQRISVLHEWGPRIDPPGQPPELPPLPNGWTHQQEHSEEGVAFDNYETLRGSVTVYYDGTVSLRGITVQAKDVHAVLSHHLATNGERR